MKSNKMNRSGLLAALVAFILQGSWAVYANHSYGLFRSVRAGIIQGLFSGCMVFIFTLAIEYLLRLFRQFAPVVRLILTVIVSMAGLIAILLAIHTIAGTPNPLLTIALPVTAGTIYSMVYCLGRIFRGRQPDQSNHT